MRGINVFPWSGRGCPPCKYRPLRRVLQARLPRRQSAGSAGSPAGGPVPPLGHRRWAEPAGSGRPEYVLGRRAVNLVCSAATHCHQLAVRRVFVFHAPARGPLGPRRLAGISHYREGQDRRRDGKIRERSVAVPMLTHSPSVSPVLIGSTLSPHPSSLLLLPSVVLSPSSYLPGR